MTDTINSVTCPQAIRTKRRRRSHTRWWNSPEWITFRDKHARTPEATCAHCHYHHGEQRKDLDGNPRVYKTGKHKGQPIIVSLTINHRDREAYRIKADYMKWVPGKTEICCNPCNRHWEKGEVICPVCNTNYIHWAADPFMCRECRERANPGDREQRLEKQRIETEQRKKDNALRDKKFRAKLNPFPCAYKLLTGRCSKSQQQCTFSRQKCLRDAKLGGCPKSKKRVEKK